MVIEYFQTRPSARCYSTSKITQHSCFNKKFISDKKSNPLVNKPRPFDEVVGINGN